MDWLKRLLFRGSGPGVPHVAEPTDAPLPEAPVELPARADRTYRVRQGVTLESIAILVYGSRTHAARLIQDNRARLGDPPVLYPGQELRLR